MPIPTLTATPVQPTQLQVEPKAQAEAKAEATPPPLPSRAIVSPTKPPEGMSSLDVREQQEPARPPRNFERILSDTDDLAPIRRSRANAQSRPVSLPYEEFTPTHSRDNSSGSSKILGGSPESKDNHPNRRFAISSPASKDYRETNNSAYGTFGETPSEEDGSLRGRLDAMSSRDGRPHGYAEVGNPYHTLENPDNYDYAEVRNPYHTLENPYTEVGNPYHTLENPDNAEVIYDSIDHDYEALDEVQAQVAQLRTQERADDPDYVTGRDVRFETLRNHDERGEGNL